MTSFVVSSPLLILPLPSPALHASTTTTNSDNNEDDCDDDINTYSAAVMNRLIIQPCVLFTLMQTAIRVTERAECFFPPKDLGFKVYQRNQREERLKEQDFKVYGKATTSTMLQVLKLYVETRL